MAALGGSSIMPMGPAAFAGSSQLEAFGFNTGRRRLHVSAAHASPRDGATPDATFATIQDAVDAARPGDVVTVAAGVYRKLPRIQDKAGTRSLPIWVVAEQRGSVTVSDTWQEAEEGTVPWTPVGDGVFAAPRDVRPYIGAHDGDFLMAYLSEADLRAASITAFSAIAGSDREVSKPAYGFAFAPSENRVYLRLRDNLDPNGRAIKLTETFARDTITVTRSSNIILDGFVIEGAGDTQAVSFDDHCTEVTVRNCVFRLARHGVRCPSNTILDTCTYEYVGLALG